MSVTYERGCFSYRGSVIVEGCEIGSFSPGLDGRIWVSVNGETHSVITDKQAESLIVQLYSKGIVKDECKDPRDPRVLI